MRVFGRHSTGPVPAEISSGRVDLDNADEVRKWVSFIIPEVQFPADPMSVADSYVGAS
jgi:hypothetical protein